MFKKLLCLLAMLMAHAAFAATAVDVNKADQAALQSVKGIGQSVSTRILDERKKGAFKNWADLIDRVKGVGEGNASRFSKEGLTVGGVTYTPSSSAAKTEPRKVNIDQKKGSSGNDEKIKDEKKVAGRP